MTVVVFLHGRGLGPETLDKIAPAFPGAELIAPIGGVALSRGHTWFENIETGIARPESVRAAEDRLLAWLDKNVADRQRIWLAGFSNGGAMAGHMLLRNPDLFQGAALFAAPLVLPPWPAGVLRDKDVLYAHGDATDKIVNQTYYLAASSYLNETSGARCVVRRYAASHRVTPEMVADGRRWFAEVSG
jgi:phospholipase/carboxylesterase